MRENPLGSPGAQMSPTLARNGGTGDCSPMKAFVYRSSRVLQFDSMRSAMLRPVADDSPGPIVWVTTIDRYPSGSAPLAGGHEHDARAIWPEPCGRADALIRDSPERGGRLTCAPASPCARSQAASFAAASSPPPPVRAMTTPTAMATSATAGPTRFAQRGASHRS